MKEDISNKSEKDQNINTDFETTRKELEAEKTLITKKKNALDKVRRRSIELFSEKQEIKKDYDKVSKQKTEIENQKTEIEEKNARLQKALEKAKRRTIDLFGKHIDLKKATKRIEFQNKLIEKKNTELEHKNKDINDSFSYAKLIQEAILPSKKNIASKFSDSFILFKPKDIVSGDFYWFSEINNKQFLALADCTGHGVPGALMSMVGNSLLNKIINDNKNYTPSRILQLLNKEVVFALHQSFDIESSQNDGMDITLCVFDKTKKEVTIASATQNCYVVKDNNLITIKGDIFSIGGIFAHHPDLKFTDHKIKLGNKTTIYMFSDGYQDQFGGPKNKKFLSSKLKDLLMSNSNLPMNRQKEILEKEFNSWKNTEKQIDDVLVIGIKIDRP